MREESHFPGVGENSFFPVMGEKNYVLSQYGAMGEESYCPGTGEESHFLDLSKRVTFQEWESRVT